MTAAVVDTAALKMSARLTASAEVLGTAFFSIDDAHDIAVLLDVPHKTLMFHLYGRSKASRYTEFAVPKRSGGSRRILVPGPSLKLIQQKLNQVLQAVYDPKPATHGFVRSKNIVSNAAAHRRRRFVLNADLTDFFPSINFGRVRGMFMAKPYNRNAEVATVLAQICCFDNQLPQGAPTSPIVSNMVCRKLDSDLQKLAQRNNATFTRYADDLTFSTNEKTFPSPLGIHADGAVHAGDELMRTIVNNGFSINEKKTRLRTRADRQEVTGLTVNARVNIDRRYIRRIRAAIHRRRIEGRSPTDERVLKGMIDFVGLVRGKSDNIYRRFLTQYARLVPEFSLPPPPQDAVVSVVERHVWVIESDGITDYAQGTACLIRGFGFVTCDHVLRRDSVALRADGAGGKHRITIRDADADADLALISIEGVNPAGDTGLILSNEPPGQLEEVFVVGFPNFSLGATLQVHAGQIAGTRRHGNARRLSLGPIVFSGASGGPVVNIRHEVIGIAVTGAYHAGVTDDTDYHGAIPVDVLRSFLNRSAR